MSERQMFSQIDYSPQRIGIGLGTAKQKAAQLGIERSAYYPILNRGGAYRAILRRGFRARRNKFQL
jgi:hypothetical protein